MSEIQDKLLNEIDKWEVTDDTLILFVDSATGEAKLSERSKLRGVWIDDIKKTAGTGEAGTTDTYTIFYTNWEEKKIYVKNGKDGKDGKGDMTASNNLSDLKNKAQARSNLDIYSKQEVDNKNNSKVDKVDWKGLSANDFTDIEKAKLSWLNNYDDTVIKNKIIAINATIENWSGAWIWTQSEYDAITEKIENKIYLVKSPVPKIYIWEVTAWRFPSQANTKNLWRPNVQDSIPWDKVYVKDGEDNTMGIYTYTILWWKYEYVWSNPKYIISLQGNDINVHDLYSLEYIKTKIHMDSSFYNFINYNNDYILYNSSTIVKYSKETNEVTDICNNPHWQVLWVRGDKIFLFEQNSKKIHWISLSDYSVWYYTFDVQEYLSSWILHGDYIYVFYYNGWYRYNIDSNSHSWGFNPGANSKIITIFGKNILYGNQYGQLMGWYNTQSGNYRNIITPNDNQYYYIYNNKLYYFCQGKFSIFNENLTKLKEEEIPGDIFSVIRYGNQIWNTKYIYNLSNKCIFDLETLHVKYVGNTLRPISRGIEIV